MFILFGLGQMEGGKVTKLVAAIICLSIITVASTQSGAHENASPMPKKLFTKHFRESLFDITGQALYSVEVLPNDKEYHIGKGTIGVVVHNDKDEDVAGAELVITYKNIETGKLIMPTKIEDNNNGLYIVSGLDNLLQPGLWELKITVNKKGIKDSVKFALPEAFKKPYPKGRYSP